MEAQSSIDRVNPPLTDLSFHPLRQLAAALRTESRRLGSARVVDVGCGAMPYRSFFEGDYLGIDYTGTHGRPHALASGERLPFRSSSVDVVLSTQNLEHVLDPDDALRESRRVLRPGGHVLLSTHGVWVHHPDPHDYWRWTEEGLIELFSRNGFEVERVHHLTEVFLTGLLLSAYPIGAAATRGRGVVGGVAGAAIAVLNAIGFGLERLARFLPRHYSSIGYLVVARRLDD